MYMYMYKMNRLPTFPSSYTLYCCMLCIIYLWGYSSLVVMAEYILKVACVRLTLCVSWWNYSIVYAGVFQGRNATTVLHWWVALRQEWWSGELSNDTSSRCHGLSRPSVSIGFTSSRWAQHEILCLRVIWLYDSVSSDVSILCTCRYV